MAKPWIPAKIEVSPFPLDPLAVDDVESSSFRSSTGGFAMAMASPRRNERAKRPAPGGVVIRNEGGTHEVEVSKAPESRGIVSLYRPSHQEGQMSSMTGNAATSRRQGRSMLRLAAGVGTAASAWFVLALGTASASTVNGVNIQQGNNQVTGANTQVSGAAPATAS